MTQGIPKVEIFLSSFKCPCRLGAKPWSSFKNSNLSVSYILPFMLHLSNQIKEIHEPFTTLLVSQSMKCILVVINKY